MVLKSPHREIFEQFLKLDFKVSNNEAKYEVLINGLKMSLTIGILRIKVLTDSQKVAQLNGKYKAREKRIVQHVKVSQDLTANFESFKIIQVPREENKQANALANMGSTYRTS